MSDYLPGIVRVYRDEWVMAQTMTGSIVDGQDPDIPYKVIEEAMIEIFAVHYAGKIRDTDWQVRRFRVFEQPPASTVMARLMLRLPVCKGEFKQHQLANQFAKDSEFDEYTVVVRDSKEDHELRAYGSKRITGVPGR